MRGDANKLSWFDTRSSVNDHVLLFLLFYLLCLPFGNQDRQGEAEDGAAVIVFILSQFCLFKVTRRKTGLSGLVSVPVIRSRSTLSLQIQPSLSFSSPAIRS